MTASELDVEEVRRRCKTEPTIEAAARSLGVGRSALASFMSRNGIKMPRWRRGQRPDPTPQEIEERKREIRERHMAMKRAGLLD